MGFSVSMCVYKGDNPLHLKDALNSVFKQTLMPDEVVLAVDGPIEDLHEEVIKEYVDKYSMLKIVRIPENVGQGEARRVSVSACTQELVAIMDSDDVSSPDRFEILVNEFKSDSALTICGGQITEFIGEQTNIVALRRVPLVHEEIAEYMKERCPFNQVSVMFRKDAYDRAGGYVDWYQEEDYFLWVKMYLGGAKFKNVDKTLVNVRVGEQMYKRRGGWKYFKSERKFQQYLKETKLISGGCYFKNVCKRFIVQVLMPNCMRSWVFKRFARENVNEKI